MKNNGGFSIVELIVSFSLTMIIVVILFEIIVYMKELYEKSVTETELLNRQNLMTDYIYTDIMSKDIYEVSVCGNNCIEFAYMNGSQKQLEWDTSFGSLKYGDYVINLITNTNFDHSLSLSYDGARLDGVKICYGNFGDAVPNSYVSIKLPLYNSLFSDKDFGINIFYVYDNIDTSIYLPLSDNC